METATLSYTQFLATGFSSSYSSGTNSLQLMRFGFDKKAFRFKPSSRFSVRASSGGGGDSVTLLDYGVVNVRSVRNAIRRRGFDIKDVQTPDDILNAKHLIFPGVGAFAAAMDVLNQNGAKLDDNARLLDFTKKLEAVCIGTVELGKLTKNLALLIHASNLQWRDPLFLMAIQTLECLPPPVQFIL